MEKTPAKRLSWIHALTITAFLCLVSFLLARAISSIGVPSLGDAVRLSCSPSHDIQMLSDGAAYSDGSRLYALDTSGKQRWTYLAGSGFRFKTSEDGVAVWLNDTLTLLDAKDGTPLYSGNLGEPILSATIGASYAAVQLGEEQTSTLLVVEREGREVNRIDLSGATVLDYGFFSGGNMLWVMSLDTEGTVPVSQLTTYRPGRMQTGNITDLDQVVYRVLFQSSQVCTVGTIYEKVYDYKGVEDTSARRLIYGWYLLDVGGDGDQALRVFAPQAQADTLAHISDVRIVTGNSDRIMRMPFSCFDVEAHGGNVYGFADQYIMAIRPDDVKATTYPLPMTVDGLVGITGNGSAVLVSGEYVYMVRLP